MAAGRRRALVSEFTHLVKSANELAGMYNSLTGESEELREQLYEHYVELLDRIASVDVSIRGSHLRFHMR